MRSPAGRATGLWLTLLASLSAFSMYVKLPPIWRSSPVRKLLVSIALPIRDALPDVIRLQSLRLAASLSFECKMVLNI
jgi:hypothetical protein